MGHAAPRILAITCSLDSPTVRTLSGALWVEEETKK